MQQGPGEPGGPGQAGLVDGQLPGRGNDPLVVVGEVARLGHDVAQQAGGQQLQVAADGDVGVADVGGGLGQRQREHPQCPGQRVRLLPERPVTKLCLQVGAGLLGGEEGDLDRPAACSRPGRPRAAGW